MSIFKDLQQAQILKTRKEIFLHCLWATMPRGRYLGPTENCWVNMSMSAEGGITTFRRALRRGSPTTEPPTSTLPMECGTSGPHSGDKSVALACQIPAPDNCRMVDNPIPTHPGC